MTQETRTDKKDFISLYLDYTAKTECPTFFHRWTAITALSAYVGRDLYFRHGHFTLHANIYSMLIGSPGTKKSSAIKIGARLFKQAGYKTFAAKKTRQEKFLLDLAEQAEKKDQAMSGELAGFDILEENLFGAPVDEADNYTNKPPAECFVAADEFNNFIGIGNIDFISILGELWDYEGVFDYKLKNSKSVYIPNPYITILGGNTPTGFAQAFPTESIGQGFFSRLLLIYGEPTGVKYTFPPIPDAATQELLISMLHEIKEVMIGEAKMDAEAIDLLDTIYQTWDNIDDIRFEHYANRRLTHLIKLCLVMAASHKTMTITKDIVIEANTILSFTEDLMPKALGEFGKAKNAAVTHKVMEVLYKAHVPLTFQALWKATHQDLDNRNSLIEIIGSLQVADKIQVVEGNAYLPKRKVRREDSDETIDWNYLTTTEREMI